MVTIIITAVLFFIVIPFLTLWAVDRQEENKISKNTFHLIIFGLCLIPYIYSAILMKGDCMVFWTIYTALMVLTLIVVGIIKLFQNH